MAAVRKGVATTFGLLSTTGSTFSAIEKVAASGNKQVCTGYGEATHDVALVRQPTTCPECGPIPYEAVKKAQPVGDGWVILEATEIAAARSDATQFQRQVDLTPHPVEAVEAATVPGKNLYHLVPEAGHETTYALLARFIAEHPELAFMAQYAPRSVVGQYRVTVRDGVICYQERVRAENVRQAPALDLPEVPEAYLTMAEQVLAMPGMVSEYDPATYADTYADKIAALVASKQVVAGMPSLDAPAAAAPAAAPGDPMAALQAMLASVTPITANAKPEPKKAKKKVSA